MKDDVEATESPRRRKTSNDVERTGNDTDTALPLLASSLGCRSNIAEIEATIMAIHVLEFATRIIRSLQARFML